MLAELHLTHHAMLVAWGQYAHGIGLIDGLAALSFHQKMVTHTPHTKVLEFLVALLGGLRHLKELSQAAHPLDHDQEVARAWGRATWADYSGVSRTLSTLTTAETQAILALLAALSQPFITQEVELAIQAQGKLVYDADLTGRPVSNRSTSYPNTAFGYMSDSLQLGYQAALVSFHSPTYGRQWVSVSQHPGNVVACTLLEQLVRQAETQTGVRPQRRITLLQQRITQVRQQIDAYTQQAAYAETQLCQAQQAVADSREQVQAWQTHVSQLVAEYAAHERPERPYSQLAKARAKVGVYQRRQMRREREVTQGEQRLAKVQAQLALQRSLLHLFQARLLDFTQENASNPHPVRADFRVDAGFATPDNVALLIELGYEVYTKPHGNWLRPGLKRRVDANTAWVPVGTNAEMVAWPQQTVSNFPYPLDLALERFSTGDQLRYGALLHYGQDRVTQDLLHWFATYNARQTIEAGIKEGKQVFTMHHLKVRAAAALVLQEHFATFAANFVRWAAHWLTTQCPQVADPIPLVIPPSIKTQVQVLAHTSAYVSWQEQGCLLRFTDHSLFAGRSLQVTQQWNYQMLLPLFKSVVFAAL